MSARMVQRLKSPKLFAAVVLGAALYFALVGGRYTILDARRADSDLEKVRAQIEETRHQIAELEARIWDLRTDDEMLERIARERYGFIRDGEILYKFAGCQTNAETSGDCPE